MEIRPFLPHPAVIFAGICWLVGVAGCSEPTVQRSPATESESVENTAQDDEPTGERSAALKVRPDRKGSGWIVTDRLRRSVPVEQPPERIVSLLPSLTELMYAIGAGGQLVGATSYCDYPPEAAELPRVGGGTMQSLSREKLVSLQPDLVLCKWDHHSPLIEDLDRLGIESLALGPENLAGLYQEALVLGKVTGHRQEASKFVERMKDRVAELTEPVASLPPERRPTVFYQVWGDPLMTAGPHSFIGEVLELAGTRNIFHDIQQRYPKVSAEVVADRNPDIILAPSTHASPVDRSQILNRPGWSEITAVQRDRVYLIDGDQVSRCGPRLVDALEEIIRVVYPEGGENAAAEFGDR